MDYSRIYKNRPNAFWELPWFIVDRAVKFMTIWTSVLDIWAWDWRNSMFLANNWFNVTALDNCEEWLYNLLWKSKWIPNIKAILGDFRSFISEWYYDNILCNFVLHHFDRNTWLTLLQKIIKTTSYGWLNVVSWFINRWDLITSTNDNNLWFREWELIEIYRDFEILYYEERNVSLISWWNHIVWEIIARKRIQKWIDVHKIINLN